MSAIFAVIMGVSLLWTLSTDRPSINKLQKQRRYLYYGIIAVDLGLMLCMLFEIEVPFPNKFLIYDVTPWLYSQMKFN